MTGVVYENVVSLEVSVDYVTRVEIAEALRDVR